MLVARKWRSAGRVVQIDFRIRSVCPLGQFPRELLCPAILPSKRFKSYCFFAHARRKTQIADAAVPALAEGELMSRFFRLLAHLTVSIALLGTIPAHTWAQNAAGRIIGNVTDPTGAAIPGADVTVTNVATGASQHAATDETGHYQALLLPIGTYKVTIEKEGFQQRVFDNQTLQINQSLRVDGQLSVGQLTEAIEVHEQVSNVETANTTIGDTVTGPA